MYISVYLLIYLSVCCLDAIYRFDGLSSYFPVATTERPLHPLILNHHHTLSPCNSTLFHVLPHFVIQSYVWSTTPRCCFHITIMQSLSQHFILHSVTYPNQSNAFLLIIPTMFTSTPHCYCTICLSRRLQWYRTGRPFPLPSLMTFVPQTCFTPTYQGRQ